LARSKPSSATPTAWPFVLVCLILMVYAASFALPVVYAKTGEDGTNSAPLSALDVIELLLVGGEYVLYSPALSPNLLLVLGVSLLATRSWAGATTCGILALAGALAVPILGPLVDSDLQGLHLASGYYAWLSSMALLGVGGLWGWRRAPRPAGRPQSGYARLVRFVRSKQARAGRP
jgi:hypothetical protein